LIVLGVGETGLYARIKLVRPPLRLKLGEFLEESGGPATDIEVPPDAWFEIRQNNIVELYLPKSEISQIMAHR
jgi:hypothetical protein